MNALKSASPTWHPIAVPTWVKEQEASTPLKYYLKQEIRNSKLNWSLTDGKQFCLLMHNKQLPKLSFNLCNVIMTAISQAQSLFCSSQVILLLQQIFTIKLSDKTCNCIHVSEETVHKAMTDFVTVVVAANSSWASCSWMILQWLPAITQYIVMKISYGSLHGDGKLQRFLLNLSGWQV